MSTNGGITLHEVTIVGAGIAGLTAAREILLHKDEKVRVVLLEADNRVGGRIYESDDPSFPGVDVGAEFVHGSGTLLTKIIEELSIENRNDLFEEIFITSHADGGPDPEPTSDGKHGAYFVNGKLCKYDDPSLRPLNEALEKIFQKENNVSKDPSVHSALAECDLSPSLRALASASFGNTAGGPMEDLSLSMLSQFEHHWEENEVEGDFRLRIGMHGVVKAMWNELCHDSRLEMHLNCRVESIRSRESSIRVVTTDGSEFMSDAVIVTVPPPIYQELDMDLPQSKLEALSFIGFERAIKLCVKFSRPLWPDSVQSVVSSDGPVPEFWFRELPEANERENSFLAVGFIVSTAADTFVKDTSDVNGNLSIKEATSMFLEQLATTFDTPLNDFEESLVGTLFYDWKDNPYIKGGYVYPRVGLKPKHLEDLAAPVGSIFFAGEATNTNACCTVQAAMETGKRAAEQVLHKKNGSSRDLE